MKMLNPVSSSVSRRAGDGEEQKRWVTGVPLGSLRGMVPHPQGPQALLADSAGGGGWGGGVFGAPRSETTVHTLAGLYLDSDSKIIHHIPGAILKQSSQTFILSF